MFCLDKHNILVTGGDDGYVRFWKANEMAPLHKVRIESVNLSKPAPVCSISTDTRNRALVGTKNGEIWEISDTLKPIVEGHGAGEVWVRLIMCFYFFPQHCFDA